MFNPPVKTKAQFDAFMVSGVLIAAIAFAIYIAVMSFV